MRRHTRTDNKVELKILEHPSEMWYKVRFCSRYVIDVNHIVNFDFIHKSVHIYSYNGFEGSIAS